MSRTKIALVSLLAALVIGTGAFIAARLVGRPQPSSLHIDWESITGDRSADVKPSSVLPPEYTIADDSLADLHHELDVMWRIGKRYQAQDLAQFVLNVYPDDPVATAALAGIEQAQATLRVRADLTYIPRNRTKELQQALAGIRYKVIRLDEVSGQEWTDTVTLQQLGPGWLFFSEIKMLQGHVSGIADEIGTRFAFESPEQTPPLAQTEEAESRLTIGTGGSYRPLFEPGVCAFDIPDEWWEKYQFECGTLTVPEDRSQPDGQQISLQLIRFHSSSSRPAPDPLIYLTGGGGANQLHPDGIELYLLNGGDGILRERDYIFYNQRGAPLNDPALECPGLTPLLWEMAGLGLTRSECDDQVVSFMLACQKTLLSRGINLEMYNSATNAADANDLRIALGYDQANFYGTSYGTRLGLDLIRDYPEGVRSIILDSNYPTQVDFYGEFPRNAHRAFSQLFADCEADPECNEAYPNLEATFYRVVDELDANPLLLELEGGPAWIRGGDFMNAIFLGMYPADAIPWLPRWIDEAGRGDHSSLLWAYEGNLNAGGRSEGVFYSLQCREEVPFASQPGESTEFASGVPPKILEWFGNAADIAMCRSWKAGVADHVENQPVTSDVPALVLEGRYDPITPPAWGEMVAATLSRSFYYEFPTTGHGVMRSDRCALEIGLQFLDDPTTEPDASCLENLEPPDFQ